MKRGLNCRRLGLLGVCLFGFFVILTPAQERPATDALLREVVASQLRNIDARYHFRYHEEEITEDLDAAGNPKRFDTKLMEWTHTDFDSYVKYLAINGASYSPAVLADQQARIDRQMREVETQSAGQRESLRAKMREDRDKEKQFIRSLPEAFNFDFAGEQTINGHLCWIFAFTPKAGFRPPSRETSFLKTLTGKLWITENEHQLIRLIGTLEDDVDFGAGLFGSVKKGSTITLEQMPSAGGYWFPAFTEMEFRGKVFVKGQNRIETSRYSHYEQTSDAQKKIEVEKLP
jgi:hypothetical protein